MTKISICIATWNRAQKLKSIIELLENQTVEHNVYEIVVVDSNSPDKTSHNMDILRCKYNNIKYIPNAKNILAVKRNVGIINSSSDIIVFLDDDVYPTKNFIEAHLQANAVPSKTFFCGQIRFPEKLTKNSNYYHFRDQQHLKDSDIDRFLPFNNIVVMNLSFRKEYINDIGFVNENFIGYGGEDIEFGWRIIKSGYRLKYLSEALAIHREDSSTIRQYGEKLYKSGLYGDRNLLQESPEIVKSLNSRSKLIWFGKIFSFSFPFKILEKYLLITDKIRFFYSYYLYKAYIYGCLYKGRNDQKIVAPLDAEQAAKGW